MTLVLLGASEFKEMMTRYIRVPRGRRPIYCIWLSRKCTGHCTHQGFAGPFVSVPAGLGFKCLCWSEKSYHSWHPHATTSPLLPQETLLSALSSWRVSRVLRGGFVQMKLLSFPSQFCYGVVYKCGGVLMVGLHQADHRLALGMGISQHFEITKRQWQAEDCGASLAGAISHMRLTLG